jgi:hypothetical protein
MFMLYCLFQESPLSQDQAVRKHQVPTFTGLLSDLRAVAGSVVPEEDFVDPAAFNDLNQRLIAGFPADYERAAALRPVMTAKDLSDYGPHTAAIFAQWEREGGGPQLPALIAVAVEDFGLSLESAPVRAAFMAALLAEIPNDLQYHGNEHYRKVLFHTIRLIAAHNQFFSGTTAALGHDRVALLLAAACVHDMGHAGGDNLRDGVYTPGFMEQRALDIVRPYFEALDLSADDRGEIETMVFCTDITFFAGDNSPCVRMKKLYKYYFWDEDVGDASLLMMGRLRRYEDNPGLVRMAMILHEADIGTSAGLSYEQTIKETVNIIEERGAKTAGPGIVLAFLREQLGETMYTEAAKQVFGPAMRDIIARAEADVAAGRKTFYE